MAISFQHNKYWAVILGGSSGMGWAAAKKLAAEGMHLCLVHRDRKSRMKIVEEGLEKLRGHQVKILNFNMDAVRLDKMEEILSKLQAEMGEGEKIRLLLHSIAKGNLKPMADHRKEDKADFKEASGVEKKDLLKAYEQVDALLSDQQLYPELSRQDFHLTIEAMALSWYDWTKAIMQKNLFAPDARNIGLTSEGNQKAWRHYGAVSAAKLTLESLCRSMSVELAPYGLRSNVVQAGITDSPSLQRIPGNEHLKLNALMRNPFKRLTTAEDVADVIFLLCKDESAWINGAIIPVDGGEKNA